MTRKGISSKPLQNISGDFARLNEAQFTFATERGMYRIQMVGTGLSSTEKRGILIVDSEGESVISFDYIRKYLKKGLRCNVTGYGGWDSEVGCIEAMTRHWVARFEAMLARETAQAVAA